MLGRAAAPPRMIWNPTRAFIESTNVWRFMQRLGFEDREKFLRFSRENPERFWDEMMREMRVEWFEPYRQVLDASRGPEWAQWFTGGRLNIAHNCLDRWAETDRVACVWEGENGATGAVTFGEVRDQANRVANGLRALGLVAGDRVALCLPMVPEILAILYGCFKAGLTVVPIFAGFGPGAIATRLEDSGARVLFTADFLERRGKRIPLAARMPPFSGHTIVLRTPSWDDFLRRPAAGIADALARFRSTRLPALHLGHHGQAQGHGAHARRMPGANGQGDLAGLRPPRRRPLLLAQRHRLDDGSVDHPGESPVRRHDLSL